MVHPAQVNIETLMTQCDVKRTRATGPGGQHRNKVETAIVITHRISGVVGQASESRNQQANLKSATQRLRVNLALAIRDPVSLVDDDQYEPTERWRSRLQGRKINVSTSHIDFPALLCEALDVVASVQFDVSTAAKYLLTSTSQLIKFLKQEPAALLWLNREREQLGMHRLK
ncbi:MAG: peptide chain release factor-like protein [Planctomycetota bacterium]